MYISFWRPPFNILEAERIFKEKIFSRGSPSLSEICKGLLLSALVFTIAILASWIENVAKGFQQCVLDDLIEGKGLYEIETLEDIWNQD